MAKTLVVALVVGAILGVAGAYGVSMVPDWKVSHDRSTTAFDRQRVLERLHHGGLAPDRTWLARK